MKRVLLALIAIFVFSVQEDAEAKVIWDGGEIVEGQNGKMTFKKDVKVYKQLPNGQYESLVVKRNTYFRVYKIEYSYNKTYYWMSSGYRVQATDLVIFKEIPNEVREQVMTDYYYYVSNPNGAEFRTRRSDTLGTVVKKVDTGYSFFGPAVNNGYITQSFFEMIQCYEEECQPQEKITNGFINAKNVKQAEKTAAPYKAGSYLVLTQDARMYANPITKEYQKDYSFSSTYFDKQTVSILPKGTVVQTSGKLVGGLLQVGDSPYYYQSAYIDLKNVAPLPKPTTQYLQYGQDLSDANTGWDYVSIAGLGSSYVPRNEAVQVYATNGIKSFVSYKSKYGFVPSKALSSKKANVPSITGTIAPKSELTVTYHNLHFTPSIDQPTVLTSNDGKSWLAADGNGFFYEETDNYFRFKHHITHPGYTSDYGWYTIQKPIKEGSKIDSYGKVLTIFDTYKTPAGTFKNVFLTDMGYYIAPGYGVIQFWDSAYATEIK